MSTLKYIFFIALVSCTTNKQLLKENSIDPYAYTINKKTITQRHYFNFFRHTTLLQHIF